MKKRNAPFSALVYALCLLVSAPAHAEIRALLIGVGDYQYLDADLKGPGFDVALMAQTLQARGVAVGKMTALTTMHQAPDMPQGIVLGTPTKSEIISAMQGLVTASAAGDTVVFYFSGHGSQAPDTSGDEQGGADEILLPMDAAGWNGAISAVENALLDDELQAWAAQLTAQGVKLVGVIDACHSGTGFRAASGSGKARVLAPAALGIPDDVPLATTLPVAPLAGEFAFLYSSQADQRSFEYPLGDGDGQRWHGAFTLALAQVLAEVPGASWGQVLAATRSRMTQGSARQEPDGEGPLLSQPVFGEGQEMRRFAIQGGLVKAGLLQGLTEGSTVSLFATPANGEVLATAKVVRLTANTATLDFAGGMVPDNAQWIEVLAPAPPPPLRLAALERGADVDPSAMAAIEATFTALSDEGVIAPNSKAADLVPITINGTLALAGPDGVLDPLGFGSTPRAVPREGESGAGAAMRLLENAAHATRMRSVLVGLGAGRGLAIGGPAIGMDFERKAGALAGTRCDTIGKALPSDPAQGVNACDELWLTLTNRSGRIQDVTVLYLAQDFTLTPLWPLQNLSNRLALGESVRIGLRIDAADPATFAAEEILVLALSPDVDEPRADLSALATPDRLRATSGAGSIGQAFGLINRLMAPDEAAQSRGFALKRPELTFLRQSVKLRPAAPP